MLESSIAPLFTSSKTIMKLLVSISVALSLLLGHGVKAAHPKVTMSEDPVNQNTFIIVLKDVTDSDANASSVHAMTTSLTVDNPDITVTAVFDKAIQGFAAQMTTEEAEALAESDAVAYIEQDGKVYAPDIVDNIFAVAGFSWWGLDRVDQRKLPLDRSYSPTGHGQGVTAYIIDSGIRTTHEEFEGRATWGKNFAGDDRDYDCYGHGTHVAGTVAGKTYGVANQANVVAVKVLGCDGGGSWSGLIAAVDWVMKNAKKPATANLSIGSSLNTALNTAVTNLHNYGIPVVVAAMNDNVDACNISPASARDVITVGATTNTDARRNKSNWGKCVDIMAPGSEITSASKQGDNLYAIDSGTSMAAPHVCGGVALLLESKIPAADVRAELTARATHGVLSNVPSGTPNRLLYVGSLSPPTGTPTTVPTSTPTPPSSNCVSGETAVFTSSPSSTEGFVNNQSLIKVKNLKIGDSILGFDSKLAPASCKVEAIGSFGVGQVYGNYTAGHYVLNPDSGKVEQNGMTDPPSWEEKFDLISDCPLIEDESGKSFSPIDSDFCGGDMKEIPWNDYLLLHSAILRVVRASGTFWFKGSSYDDMSMVHKLAPRVCKNMLKCMKDNTNCKKFEQVSREFINRALKKSAKMKARKAFSRIGYPCEIGSVSAVLTSGKTLYESVVGNEAC